MTKEELEKLSNIELLIRLFTYHRQYARNIKFTTEATEELVDEVIRLRARIAELEGSGDGISKTQLTPLS